MPWAASAVTPAATSALISFAIFVPSRTRAVVIVQVTNRLLLSGAGSIVMDARSASRYTVDMLDSSAVSSELLRLVVCPACRSALLDGDAVSLRCTSCQRVYPIVDGIPI